MEKKKKEREDNSHSLQAYQISEKSVSENSMAGLFGDGIIPKNKSLNNFHSDIQEETELEKFLKKKRSILTPTENNSDFIYG